MGFTTITQNLFEIFKDNIFRIKWSLQIEVGIFRIDDTKKIFFEYRR